MSAKHDHAHVKRRTQPKRSVPLAQLYADIERGWQYFCGKRNINPTVVASRWISK